MRNQGVLLALALGLAACSSSTKVSRPLDQGEVVQGKAAAGTAAASGGSAPAIAIDYLVADIAVADDKIPEAFPVALKSYLKDELSKAGRLAKSDLAARTVKLTLSDYRMRGDITRFMVGVLAGSDHVTVAVSVLDKSGQVIGESQVKSSNALAVGGPDMLAKMAAEETAKFLVGAPLKK